LLTEDAVWFPPGSDPIVGRKAFREWLSPFFNKFLYEFDISNKRITTSGGRAVERAGFTSKMTPKEGGEPMRHSGTFIALWHRDESGIWRIERYIDDTNI
jgi:ketosteroid isomerase-like protein